MMMRRVMRLNALKIAGDRHSSFDLARGRLVFISTCFVLAYMIMAVRAFDLSVLQHIDARDDGVQMPVLETAQADFVPRADIVDRNGELLTTTLKTASLYADPQYIADPKEAAEALVKIFPDLSYGDVLQKLQSKRRFVWLKRGILPEEQHAVLRIGEPGLRTEYEYRRVYPQGSMLSHLLGYANVDNKGQAGIERSFDGLLVKGDELALTVDLRLQHTLRREVERAMTEFNALGGVGVIMDVNTGEILAGTSMPDFDPHNPGRASADSIFNRLTLGVYEYGSVFKIFSTAALLDTLNVPMSTTFDAREPIKIGRFKISDYHAEGRELSVPEVFMYSSNIGSAMMGQAVGTQALRDFYSDLGLLDPLDFEIKEVGHPIVPHPWREINTLTASYGHGVATTAMQLTAAVASIVNGGYAVKPHLVKGDYDPNATRVRVVSEDTSNKMRQLMRLVVTDGTGGKADVSGYVVGGKTGTAEKPGGRKGYDHKRLISSFVGVFPMDHPKYAVFIAIDEPKGNKASFGYATAGWVAAPAVARVVASMASILGMEPVSDQRDLMTEPVKHLIADKEGRHG